MRRLLAVGLVVGTALGAARVEAQSLPPTAAKRPGTPQKGTEILWDTWGVPHVFAKSVPEMFFCWGWAQAEAHGNLLLHALGESRGRASEYFGPGVADRNIRSDRWVWLNEVPKRSEVWLRQQTPEFRGYLEAFAAGINAYAVEHPEALAEDARRVLPVRALDVIANEQHFINFEFVANERLMSSPVEKTAAAAKTLPAAASLERPHGAGDDVAAFAPGGQDVDDGSNGWAIAPSRSASGRAMLLMNPHLAWAGEQSYFEAQLSAPGVNLYGATQIGLPVLRFVFTDQLAITNTVNTNNGALLYRITEKDGGYVVDGKVLPYKRASYSFAVRQADGSFRYETVDVARTVQGPVIRRDDGVPIALRAAGLDKPCALDQIWKMGLAKSFDEYQEQLRRLQIPMYNILYADRDGHIEYLFNGDVAKRERGDWAFWSKPVPGDESALIPAESLTYDELPKVIDPPSGYVQNSNEPPWDAAWPTRLEPAKYPAYLAPEFALFRSDRALRMLSEGGTGAGGTFTYGDLLQRKMSTRMEMADRMLPELLAAVEQYGTARAKRAAVVLRMWDRQAEAQSTGALLFYTWAQRFVNPSVSLVVADGQRNFAVPYRVEEPLTTPRGLRDPKAAAEMLDEAAEETERLYGRLDRPWGEVMRFQINGQSDGDLKAERGAALNGVDLPGNGGYGNLGIFRVVTYGPLEDGTKTPIHGDGFTMALEFEEGGGVRARGVISYGEASQPGAKHHTDELGLVEKKMWREVWRDRDEVEAHVERRESW